MNCGGWSTSKIGSCAESSTMHLWFADKAVLLLFHIACMHFYMTKKSNRIIFKA